MSNDNVKYHKTVHATRCFLSLKTKHIDQCLGNVHVYT